MKITRIALSVLIASTSLPFLEHATAFAQIPAQDNSALVTQMPQPQPLGNPPPLKAEIKIEASSPQPTEALSETPGTVQHVTLEGNPSERESPSGCF